MSPSVVDMFKMNISQHHRLAGLYEFRLQDSKEGSDRMTTSAVMAATATASSVCSDQLSAYKQRIDSMFDDTRSSVSGAGTPSLSRRGRAVLDDLEEEDEEEYDEVDDRTQNTVQERIQKMFADVTEDESTSSVRGDKARKREQHKPQISTAHNAAPKSNNANGISTPVRNQTFSVHYLGSAPLPNRDATLQALQSPLKTLYFRYRKLEMSGRAPPINGTLDISEKGLKVKMAGPEEGGKQGTGNEMEKLTKFPSIAVWAAVKFVSRDAGLGKEDATKYAFLPLIADPDGRDKSSLFQTLPQEELSYSRGAHSPMFAVVMRKSSRTSGASPSVKRTLHCHAFVCACSEDAIVMAANLYQALVAGMSGGKKGKVKSEDEAKLENLHELPLADPSNRQDARNTVKRATSVDGGDLGERTTPPRMSDVMSSASAPVRPPRRKKGSSRHGDDARSTNSEELISMEEEEEMKRVPQIAMGRRQSTTSRVAPSHTKLSTSAKEQSGDIFTRVAIPRTGSFLDHGAAIRRTSSLGLGDLFQEVRAQEGLTSLDAILEKIVDADGMSFARLKPLYREFLLKLAATLSRDELYQRSKNIMRRQASSRRRRRRRRAGLPVSARESKRGSRADDDSSSVCGEGDPAKGGKFSWALCRSVMRAKSSRTSRVDEARKSENQEESSKSGGGGEGTSCNFEFTSVIFPSEERQGRPRAGSSSISSTLSSTGRASKSRRQKRKQFHAHRPSFNAGRSIRGSHAQPPRLCANQVSKAENQSRPRVSTSEDSSDFFSFKRKNNGAMDTNTKSSSRLGSSSGTGFGGGRSSSGYVSCSDCSFDSESCNSDKCYCPQEPQKKHQWNRLRRKESTRSRRCGEHGQHCRSAEVAWSCCDSARHAAPPCRARAGSVYGCGYRSACDGGRCVSAAPTCPAHGKVASYRCERCAGVKRCGCVPWRESPSGARGRGERRTPKVESSGGDFVDDDDDWEDEEAAVVVEDGASATSSSSWRPGAAVPKSRMDVYATLPPPRPLPETPTAANGSSGVYDRCANKKHEKTCRPRPSATDSTVVEASQQKVLVVSARDPRGRVICMGRGDQPHVPPFGGRRVLPGPLLRCSKSAATEALSVKKSAEIAALFSDDKSNHTTEVVTGEEVVYTTLEPPRAKQAQGTKTELIARRGYYIGNSLENTLGYLP